MRLISNKTHDMVFSFDEQNFPIFWICYVFFLQLQNQETWETLEFFPKRRF